MAPLPSLRRRRSRTDQALDLVKGAAKIFATIKIGSAAARAAKGGTKAYGTAKTAKVGGRPVLKLLAAPAAAAGGLVVWRKLASSSSSSRDGAGPDQGRPIGPVATAEAVSPPATAAPGKLDSPAQVADEPPVGPPQTDAPGKLDSPAQVGDEPPGGPPPTDAPGKLDSPAQVADEPPVGPSPTVASDTTK